MTNYPNDEEHLLIHRLINGDEEAFCRLYALYKNRLVYFAIKFVRSRSFAEDIFQDVFESIWKNRQFINPNQSFSAYLHTILKNRILNLIAQMDRDEHLKEKITSNAIEITECPDNKLIYEDLESLLKKAMEELTPKQKEIFNLSRNQMMSHKEIADLLGISVFTVQQHISASLKIIKNFFRKYAEMYIDFLVLLICIGNNY